MLIFRIHAGLGNQLFQYATGRAMSLRYGCDYRIDATRAASHRCIGLGAFNIATPSVDATTRQRLQLRKTSWVRLVKLLTGRDIREGKPHFFLDLPPESLAALEIDPIHQDYYFDGFYQSERNFADAAETIRSDLTPRMPLDGNNAAWEQQARDCCSVSLHIRRGDYFSPKHVQKFGVPLTDYYHRAMRLMAESLGCVHFFVFSDDQTWVRDNIRFEHPTTLVEGNHGDVAYRDLFLMAACRHHIIANSTFSWWGAWLNPNPEKRVIAPTPWLLTPRLEAAVIVPSGWTILDVDSNIT